MMQTSLPPPPGHKSWVMAAAGATLQFRRSSLFVFYPLTVIGPLALAAHFLLAPIIAVINRRTFTLYCEP